MGMSPMSRSGSSRSPAGPTWASRRSSTASSGTRSRSSPTSRRRRAGPSAASPRRPTRQLVLVDLPGVQRPRDALTQRMQSRVERELADSDVALLIINGEEGVGPGDRFLAALLREAGLPVVIAVNKIDRLNRSRTMIALEAAAELDVGEDVFPISARTGSGVVALTERLGELLPEGPFFFPEEDSSDQLAGGAPRRARARAGAAADVPGGAALGRGDRGGDRGAARGPDRHPRARVGGDGLPEGHPDRLRRADDQGGRHGRAPRARSGSWGPGCTSSCRCGCGAAGAATTACWTGWASNRTPVQFAQRPTQPRPTTGGTGETGSRMSPRRVLRDAPKVATVEVTQRKVRDHGSSLLDPVAACAYSLL